MKIDQRDADAALGGEVHAHSSWILPAIFLVVAGLIGIGFYILFTGPTVDDLQGNTAWPTAATDTADIRIDNAVFRVPANYTKLRRSRSDGDADDIPMHALLPNLAPWTQAQAKEFNSNSWNARVVQILLAVDHAKLTYQDKFDRGIRPRSSTPDGIPGPHGLTTYKFDAGTGYENTEWLTATLEDGSRFVMRCDAAATGNFGSSCMRVTRLKDGIGLTYKYKRAYLAQWKEIDAKVMAKVEGFRVK
jgi:hypothetical protein